MRHGFAICVVLATGIWLTSCASTTEEQSPAPPAEPASGELQSAAPPIEPAMSPVIICDLSDDEMMKLREAAMAYLISNWPVLDEECEQISDEMVLIYPDICGVLGGPNNEAACPPPSHAGYRITFDRQSLEPTGIYWRTE